MPNFLRDRIRFHYVDTGAGLPFVFQHGLGGDVAQTAEIAGDLPGVRFIALDCRGHGETRPLGDVAELGFIPFAADVIALLDHLGIGRAVVGGISMGAGVSLTIAQLAPERVRGLVLSRPAWLDAAQPPNLAVFSVVAGLIRTYGAQEGLVRFQQSETYADLLATAPDVAASLCGQFTHPRAEETVARLERLPADAPAGSRKDWANMREPALVLANRTDPLHPFEYGELLTTTLPNAELVEIPSKSVDKVLHIRQARAAIDRFLGQIG
jgi:pimeloyl-ACP methyl ester carboxylesterase